MDVDVDIEASRELQHAHGAVMATTSTRCQHEQGRGPLQALQEHQWYPARGVILGAARCAWSSGRGEVQGESHLRSWRGGGGIPPEVVLYLLRVASMKDAVVTLIVVFIWVWNIVIN